MNNVEKLKNSIRVTYNYNFFDTGAARVIATGQEINVKVVSSLLSSAEKGNQMFEAFVDNRLKSNKISFFHKITKLKIDTGIKKPPKTPKPVEILKEDVQGFGIIAEQA